MVVVAASAIQKNTDEPSVGPERRQSCYLWPVVGRRPVNRAVELAEDGDCWLKE
jgi:hypothetical protein